MQRSTPSTESGIMWGVEACKAVPQALKQACRGVSRLCDSCNVIQHGLAKQIHARTHFEEGGVLASSFRVVNLLRFASTAVPLMQDVTLRHSCLFLARLRHQSLGPLLHRPVGASAQKTAAKAFAATKRRTKKIRHKILKCRYGRKAHPYEGKPPVLL